MRSYTLSALMVLAMTFGFVNVDLSQILTNPTETVSFGPSEAQARRGGGGGFRSSPRRPSPSRPRATKPRATTPSKPRATAPRTPSKPAPAKRDAAATAAKRQQSKVRAAATPKPTIKTSSGKTIKVAGTPAAKSVRSMSPEKFSSRSTRKDTAYKSIPPAQRTTIVNNYGGGFYGDPFSGLFMYMLISQSLHSQAMFHHNHWDSYSAQRQQSLMSENAALRSELAAMEGKPRDPNFVPAGTDPDLIYSDEFVNAAYNPQPAPVEEKSSALTVVFILLGMTALGFGLYFIFFRRTT